MRRLAGGQEGELQLVRRRVIRAIFKEVILGVSARLQQLTARFAIKPVRATSRLITLLGGYTAAYFLHFMSNIQIGLW